MHLEIERTQRMVLTMTQDQIAYLRSKPTPYLKELLRESNAHRMDSKFSVIAAATVNKAACEVILEERA